MVVCIIAIIITLNPDINPEVITRPLGYIIIPMQTAATSVGSWLDSRISLFRDMDMLLEENRRLTEENSWLLIENQRLLLAGEENEMLSELLYIKQRYRELPTIGARIIAHYPSEWNESFNIDRGANDGIARNMIVLGSGGLVGVVHQVHSNYSQVISVIDNRFSASVQTVRTQDLGVIRGDSTLMRDGLISMNHININAQILAGDEIITSTISEIFPPAVRVGVVVDVRPTPDGLAQYAIVRPYANLQRLEHVLVVNELFGIEGSDDIGGQQ